MTDYCSTALRGLRNFYDAGSKAGIQGPHANRLRMQLAALDTAQQIDDIDIPGLQLHTLKGKPNKDPSDGGTSLRNTGAELPPGKTHQPTPDRAFPCTTSFGQLQECATEPSVR